MRVQSKRGCSFRDGTRLLVGVNDVAEAALEAAIDDRDTSAWFGEGGFIEIMESPSVTTSPPGFIEIAEPARVAPVPAEVLEPVPQTPPSISIDEPDEELVIATHEPTKRYHTKRGHR